MFVRPGLSRVAATAPAEVLRSDKVAQLLHIRGLETRGLAPTGLARFGIGPEQLALAYALQDELTAKLLSPSNRLVGWKIGFSTAEGRKPLGISEPAYGPLFSSGATSGPVATSRFAGLLVEQEIAFVMRKDIHGPVSLAELAEAIGAVHLGFELPSKRFTGSPGAVDGPTAGDMIADCLASHSFKLGPLLPRTVATSTTTSLTLLRDAAEISRGNTGMLDDGKGGLGPLRALHWLVGKLVARRARLGRQGPVLKAGDIIYTGAVPGPTPYRPDGKPRSTFAVQAGELGRVELDVHRP